MKPIKVLFTLRPINLATKLTFKWLLLIILLACKTSAGQQVEKALDSSGQIDEGVSLEPKTSLLSQERDKLHPNAPIDRNVDPFAFTFEDYLRETANSDSIHALDRRLNSNHSSGSKADSVGLIIEDDDNSIKARDSQAIDYVFPAPKQDTNNNNELNETKTNARASSADNLIERIRLLFAWRQLPTNKCSKTCGKGFKINHISCVDLKYDVRVEDELCLRANIEKPSELTDEPCNQHECPPKSSPIDETFHKTEYQLDQQDLKSNQSAGFEPSNGNPVESQYKTQIIDDYNVDYGNSAEVNNNNNKFDKNDIITSVNLDREPSDQIPQKDHHRGHQNHEPFYEPGPWTECSGAPCGQLGKRYRKLTCRLYLARSARYASVPDSSCSGLELLDTQEPCYIDCPPELETSSDSNSSSIDRNSYELMDESVYDPQVARHIWRSDGWTKCSAECLGGRRESIVECWDKVTETPVDSSLCDSGSRPQVVTETCNESPCPPEWKVEQFSQCSKLCGSAGIRTRSVSCVQQVPVKDGLGFMMVSNDLCIQSKGPKPHQLEPCNRVDCRPEWSVGPWSECSTKCGEGVRNRSIVCVQEFASRDGFRPEFSNQHNHLHRPPNPDLIEAVAISSKNWHPGKVTQVPFDECFQEYRTIPALDEKCFTRECPKTLQIDSNSQQNFIVDAENAKKRTITLKIGGKAQIFEGMNLKLRCRIINKWQADTLVKGRTQDSVQWTYEGIPIFTNRSRVVEKQDVLESNSIKGKDTYLSYDLDLALADQPNVRSTAKPSAPVAGTKRRNLSTRSWKQQFNFMPTKGGRFSFKENSLRIKRLKQDDSGHYTCSYGNLTESIDLRVINKYNTEFDEKSNSYLRSIT